MAHRQSRSCAQPWFGERVKAVVLHRARRIALVALGVLCAAAAATPASAVDPQIFADVSSGIVRVRAECRGGASVGTGFLVGTRVVMTARHVVRACHDIRVHTTSGWITVKNASPWYENDDSDIDIATLRLDSDADGHVFQLRTSQARAGLNVAAIGHPLGTAIGVTQGKIMFRSRRHVFVRLLGAEGASGSPFVDGQGRVVAILQNGYGSEDAIGQRTAGVVSGYDFSSRWAAWRRVLCQAYPYGGIADCGV
jgi:S1-C subfamily serine protease